MLAIENISLEGFDLSLSGIRLINPSRVRQVEKSMAVHGQLQPVVARSYHGGYQLIDGFKRYYSAEKLGMDSLQCRVLDIDLTRAKVLLLSYNRSHQSMDAWEEAMVLDDLIRVHDLDQKSLAEVTGYSRSWVSRRLSLIEKMDADLSSEIMIGNLTSSHARELIKLPRVNQKDLARVIISHSLTSRQSGALVDAWKKATGNTQKQHVLDHPLEVIERRHDDYYEPYDPRLSRHGNELKVSTRYMKKSLIILVSRMQDDRTGELSESEKIILLEDLVTLSNYYEKLVNLITKLKTTAR
jgi:ParB family transcriptional regulator, chromosome partitioning protein